MTKIYIRCIIAMIIIIAGICVREDHFAWAIILMLIGTIKYLANVKIIIEKEATKG